MKLDDVESKLAEFRRQLAVGPKPNKLNSPLKPSSHLSFTAAPAQPLNVRAVETPKTPEKAKEESVHHHSPMASPHLPQNSLEVTTGAVQPHLHLSCDILPCPHSQTEHKDSVITMSDSDSSFEQLKQKHVRSLKEEYQAYKHSDALSKSGVTVSKDRVHGEWNNTADFQEVPERDTAMLQPRVEDKRGHSDVASSDDRRSQKSLGGHIKQRSKGQHDGSEDARYLSKKAAQTRGSGPCNQRKSNLSKTQSSNLEASFSEDAGKDIKHTVDKLTSEDLTLTEVSDIDNTYFKHTDISPTEPKPASVGEQESHGHPTQTPQNRQECEHKGKKEKDLRKSAKEKVIPPPKFESSPKHMVHAAIDQVWVHKL